MPMSPPLSYDLANHPPADTIKMLTGLLERITKTNDKLYAASVESGRHPHPRASAYTCFHARSIPNIDIHSYLNRILKYCPCANECFLSLLVYFDRMSRNSSGLRIDSYNIHRLVISGIMVASKFFSDIFFTNSRYAKVGGLPVAELNALEVEFLQLNDYNLSVSIEELQQYGDQLLQHCMREEERRREAEYRRRELKLQAEEERLARATHPDDRPRRCRATIDNHRSSSVDSSRHPRKPYVDAYSDRRQPYSSTYTDLEHSLGRVKSEVMPARHAHSRSTSRHKADLVEESRGDSRGVTPSHSFDVLYESKVYTQHRHTWHPDHGPHRLPTPPHSASPREGDDAF